MQTGGKRATGRTKEFKRLLEKKINKNKKNDGRRSQVLNNSRKGGFEGFLAALAKEPVAHEARESRKKCRFLILNCPSRPGTPDKHTDNTSCW